MGSTPFVGDYRLTGSQKKQLAENQRIVKLNHEISLLTQSLRANDEPSNLDHLESAKRVRCLLDSLSYAG